MKHLIPFLVLLLLVSCSSNPTATSDPTAKESDNSKIIDTHIDKPFLDPVYWDEDRFGNFEMGLNAKEWKLTAQ